MQNKYKYFDGFLDALQLRQILSYLAFFNLKLSSRPRFMTVTDDSSGIACIKAIIPEYWFFEKFSCKELGEYLFDSIKDLIAFYDDPELNAAIAKVKNGEWTFLAGYNRN